jgi:hypothetical protein
MPIHHTPADEPTCVCGARLDDDTAYLCRKCTSRWRWQRRRANARRHIRPGRTGRQEPPL